jgi:hypothetical protein
MHSIGTICTRACLAQRKTLASVMLHEVVPKLYCNDHLLLQKASYDDGLHMMTCVFYQLNDFDSRTDVNLFNSKLLFSFIFFMDKG